tara:strand:- start:217 stop:498 length:282 start_codon:yes stop_codon:yes gene_type:complete
MEFNENQKHFLFELILDHFPKDEKQAFIFMNAYNKIAGVLGHFQKGDKDWKKEEVSAVSDLLLSKIKKTKKENKIEYMQKINIIFTNFLKEAN